MSAKSLENIRVGIIMATTGADTFEQALKSVAEQTHKNTFAYVVVDGPDRAGIFEKPKWTKYFDKCVALGLPQQTGVGGYNGHRIYGGVSFLVNADYIGYLDEDNWLEQNHVESCLKAIKKNNWRWCHALRKIRELDGSFVCDDHCGSLGRQINCMGLAHVDTSCYFMERELAVTVGSAHYTQQPMQDQRVYRMLSHYFPAFGSTGKHTLNYRVSTRPGQMTAKHFLEANKMMRGKKAK